MSTIVQNGEVIGGLISNADEINYNNTKSALKADNLQDAIDELDVGLGSANKFNAGETYSTMGLFIGLSASAGNSFSFTVALPKIINASTVTVTGTIGWVRGQAKSITTTGATLTVDNFKNNNVIVAVTGLSGLAAMSTYGVYLSNLKFTFA